MQKIKRENVHLWLFYVAVGRWEFLINSNCFMGYAKKISSQSLRLNLMGYAKKSLQFLKHNLLGYAKNFLHISI